MTDETNSIFISQANQYLDMILTWYIVYCWLDWEWLKNGMYIGAFVVVVVVILYYHNRSLDYSEYDCGKQGCFICKKEKVLHK